MSARGETRGSQRAYSAEAASAAKAASAASQRSIRRGEPGSASALTESVLLAGWTPRRIGRRVVVLADVDSTNTYALAAARDVEADGLAVFAEQQTAGRGRQGRAWLSPRGASILCSVLLIEGTPNAERRVCRGPQPQKNAVGGPGPQPQPTSPTLTATEQTAGRLTLAAGVAACEAVAACTDVAPAIKWPNDVRVRGRKLAGILIESRPIAADLRAWVIGIGINCLQQAGHFPPELRDQATSLEIESAQAVDRARVGRELLVRLDAWLGSPPTEVTESLHRAWLLYAEPIGQRVVARCAGREYQGRSLAVDPDGGLILQCDDGTRAWLDPLLTSIVSAE